VPAIFMGIIVAAAWCIWSMRNGIIFDGKTLSLWRWKQLLREELFLGASPRRNLFFRIGFLLSSFLLAFVQFVVFPLLDRLIPFIKSSALGVFTYPDFLKKMISWDIAQILM
jgi:hypothetical protein